MISVLTVNFDSSADLDELAASLRSHRGDESVELVVCNNSPDDRIKTQSSPELPITVIEQDNIGFGAGINRAFAASTGDIILIANPDVRITAGTLTLAKTTLAKQPDIGILLPLLRYPDGVVQPSVRRFYTWPVVFYARSPLRGLTVPPKFFRDYLHEDLDRSKPTDVDWGLGAAMFLRRSDVPEIGPFDERFFLYFEDVDLCVRTWRAGRRVTYDPTIACIHAHRRASRRALSAAGWHHFRSLWRFAMKYSGLPKRPQ